jgi:serine/threonine protein kinase
MRPSALHLASRPFPGDNGSGGLPFDVHFVHRGSVSSMVDKQVGPFVLGKKLGDGGMGVVYRATYTKTGQEVALKLLPPELQDNEKIVARFERELDILKKLKHPHIVQCYGGGRRGTQRFYAMELIAGGSLSQHLRMRGQLPWEEVLDYGLQICQALAYAHGNGIIHRDIKPANLLITKNGQLKLSDFGIARDNAATALTATGRTVGTYHYMAPEQIKEGNVSHKADLYALGCVLYELLTGEPPFDGESPAKIFYKHLEDKPPRAAKKALDCPVWLDSLITQLLEKDPANRPFDAASVEHALKEIREKVEHQQSLAQHAVSGQPTALAVTTEVEAARQLLQKKRKRKVDKGPIYQKTWFLVTCLVGLLGVIGWSLLPLGEEQLFRRAEAKMKSEDPADWRTANELYLTPLQTRFPKGQYATQVQGYIDRIEMSKAEERLKMSSRIGLDPKSEGERLYITAFRYEQFGDRVTALEHYRSLVQLLQGSTDPGQRAFVNLARRQMAKIDAAGGTHEDRQKIVGDALHKADQLYASGQTLEARKMWQSVVTLYEKNQELEPQVAQAQERLMGGTRRR